MGFVTLSDGNVIHGSQLPILNGSVVKIRDYYVRTEFACLFDNRSPASHFLSSYDKKVISRNETVNMINQLRHKKLFFDIQS